MHLDTEQDRYEERGDRLKKWLGIAGKWFVVAALAIAITVSMPKTSLAVGKGAHGPDVYVIQGMLKALGSYSGPITGHYNQATVRGVKYYQKKHGLPVTGTVDKRTFTSLVYAYSSKRIGGGQSWRGKSDGRSYGGQGGGGAGIGGGGGQGGGGAGIGGGTGQGGGGAGIGGGTGQGGGGAGIGGGAGQGGGGAGIGGGTGQGGGQGQGIEEEQEDLGKGKTELKEELKEEKKDEIKEEKKEEIKDEDHGKAKVEDHGKVKEDEGHDHGKAKGDQGYGGNGGGQQPQAPQGDTKDDKGYGYGGRGN
ncbi:peptidoglycan-binding protein [Cohnella sp.]|uniref:peptidoglycan-binding domain-containing protein n=1 Tax=Cohnella sp. TaxID=1883426 RepID=UPI003562A9D5